MNKLKAGVIGLGMGMGHLHGYLSHPDVEVTAIADARADRIEALSTTAPEFKGKTYTNGMAMLEAEKLDIVSVVVPNFLHKDLTIAALESGANVLCEKPMAMNAAEAEEMLAAAKRCGKKLGINFSFRFTPQSRAMKDIVDSGALGDIYYGRSVWMRRRGIPGLNGGAWFFSKDKAGGGPLIDLGVHRLDLALWLMGYPEPAYVMGNTYCPIAGDIAAKQGIEYTVEDFACAMIKFKNGASLELDASWAANIREAEQMTTRLLGSKGGLHQYNLNETYTFEVELYNEQYGRQYDTKLHDNSNAPSAYHMFADAVRDNSDFLVKPEEGITVMRLLDAIYESGRTGKPVEIK